LDFLFSPKNATQISVHGGGFRAGLFVLAAEGGAVSPPAGRTYFDSACGEQGKVHSALTTLVNKAENRKTLNT